MRKLVFLCAGTVSLFLSVWSYFKTAVMNPDGICYLQSAEAMSSGLSTAMHLCDQAKWPLFSALIYGVSRFTHLSIEHAAYVLDGFFSLISVFSFIAIVGCLHSSKRILWLAALVILTAHEFNGLRVDVVRDHGFWAFYLISLFLLLTYFQQPRWRTAIAWSVSLIIALLFRIEGLIFFVLLPFLSFLMKEKKVKSFFQLNTVLIVGVLFIAAYVWKQGAEHLGRVDEVKFQVVNGFHMLVQNFNITANNLGTHVLSMYSAGDAKIVLFLMLLSWYVYSVAANLSFIYAVLVVYAWVKKAASYSRSQRLVLWAYVLLNVLITCVFLAENMFLSKRYLMALSLTLMVWVPFALDYLIQQFTYRKWPLVLSLVLISVSAVGGVISFGPSKNYLRQAGDWLAVHVPASSSLYVNDYQVMYYSRHFGNDIFPLSLQYTKPNFLTQEKWQQFDFIVLRFNKKEIEKNEIHGAPAQVFQNTRGDQVRIYQISK